MLASTGGAAGAGASCARTSSRGSAGEVCQETLTSCGDWESNAKVGDLQGNGCE